MPRGVRGTKVKYTCDICGWTTSNKSKYTEHSRRDRKKPCEPGRRGGTYKRTTEQVIEDFRKTHGNRYLYGKFVYVGDKDQLAIMTCRCHGDFQMSSNNHQRGQNCPECARIHRSRVKINKYRAICIKKFVETHGEGTFDYNQVVYKLGRENVTIICPVVTNDKIHGPFLQTPENHWGGAGCPTCATIARSNSKRNTREGIIARFKERWPFEEYGYSYDNFEYVDYNDTPGIMTCPKHGDFLQTAAKHLDKRNLSGCFQCGNELSGLANADTLESFIQKATSKHGEKFDYSMSKYIDSTTPIKVGCPNHGMQLQTPWYHLNGTHGCALCANEATADKMRVPFEVILKRCIERFGDRFDYSECGYVDTHTKFKPRCIKHDKIFEVIPHGHLKAETGGCTSCSLVGVSKKQLLWLQYEQDKLQQYIQTHMSEKGEYKIPDIGKVDGYCHETNTVYEFHGIFWHGHPDFFDSNTIHPVVKLKTYGEKYQETLDRDEKIRNLGYKLVVIWEHEWDKITSSNPYQPYSTSSP